MLTRTHWRITSVVAVTACLVSVSFPTPGAARLLAAPDAPDAPDATLDVPTTIVNESTTEWVIHKGVIYWSNHCFLIPLQANQSNENSTPNNPASPAANTTLKRMPTGGGAVTTLGTDASQLPQLLCPGRRRQRRVFLRWHQQDQGDSHGGFHASDGRCDHGQQRQSHSAGW